MRSAAEQEQRFTRRTLLLGAGMGAVGLALTGRMAQLAVREGERYRLAAEENRVALRLIAPRRGWIVDRRGLPLAYNEPDYRLELIPDETPDLDATLAAIDAIIPLGAAEIARIRATAARQPGYIPVSVVEAMPWEVFAAVNVRLPELPGVNPVRGYKRAYVNGPAYAHLLGYVARPSAEEFARTKDKLLLLPGFRVGKDGVEKSLDERLRGKAGARREEVTARGRPVRTLETVPDTPGEAVKLTIDRDLQDYVARRIGRESASVVVVDVVTGDIVAQLSLPAFDPNAFADGISNAEWAAAQSDPKHPLINKTSQGVYPPGSIFKLATALAILRAGIPPTASVVCRGGYRFGGHWFRCHSARGHGGVNLATALPQSCNAYFYHFGQMIGIDAIAAAATDVGLGQRYDLPLGSQRKGVIPTQAWKLDRFGKPWLPGDTLSCAIGQGYVASTPLQLALMTARVAAGRVVMPRLVVGGTPDFDPLPFPVEDLDRVRLGMAGVVNSNIGTARRVRIDVPGVLVAGKTGTAQAVGRDRKPKGAESRIPWRFRNHAWFVGFAPVENPRYAMCVLVEHGGAGGAIAGPIAKDVFTYLFDPSLALESVGKLEGRWAEIARVDQARDRARVAAEAAQRAVAAAAPPRPALTAAVAAGG